MTITSAFVLFAVIWFLTFLIVIPFKIKTQGDLGAVAKGTQAGAPEVHNLKKKGHYNHWGYDCYMVNNYTNYYF